MIKIKNFNEIDNVLIVGTVKNVFQRLRSSEVGETYVESSEDWDSFQSSNC